ncbi:MAG: hypothetical protein V1838_01315 [Patescibacteria group bacterium]
MLRNLDDRQEKFVQHCVDQRYGPHADPDKKNLEAECIFWSLQNAISDGLSYHYEDMKVPAVLVHHLTACAWVSLEYDKEQQIPWDGAEHDFILKNVINFFMYMLAEAIRNNTAVELKPGRLYHGGFPIPDWFVEEVRAANKKSVPS